MIEAGKQKLKEESKFAFKEPKAETTALFCYTSGTTGDPKAAKLSHRNFLTAATGVKMSALNMSENDTLISYLPLAHSFEQILFSLSLITGARIGYFSGDVLKLTEDCQVLRPTIFPSVPRIYNRIYDKI